MYLFIYLFIALVKNIITFEICIFSIHLHLKVFYHHILNFNFANNNLEIKTISYIVLQGPNLLFPRCTSKKRTHTPPPSPPTHLNQAIFCCCCFKLVRITWIYLFFLLNAKKIDKVREPFTDFTVPTMMYRVGGIMLCGFLQEGLVHLIKRWRNKTCAGIPKY